MTVKELAEFTGKTERTVQLWIKKHNEKTMFHNEKITLQKGHTTNLTIDDVERVLKVSSLSKDAVSILMNNARSKPQQNVAVDYEVIGKMIGIAISNALAPIVEKLDKVTEQKQEQLKLEAPKMDSRAVITKSINEYVSKTGMSYRDAYINLYKEFGYRTHCNPSLSAKNRNMKIIDYNDSEGQIDILAAIAIELVKEIN